MWKDPIVAEVRRVREAHADKFNHDLHAICEDFRAKQAKSDKPLVSRAPRKPRHRGAV